MTTYRIDQPLQRDDVVYHRDSGESGRVLCSPWWNDGLVVPVRRVLVSWQDAEGRIAVPSDVACIGRVERNGIVIWDESWPVVKKMQLFNVEQEEVVEEATFAESRATMPTAPEQMVLLGKDWQ